MTEECEEAMKDIKKEMELVHEEYKKKLDIIREKTKKIVEEFGMGEREYIPLQQASEQERQRK